MAGHIVSTLLLLIGALVVCTQAGFYLPKRTYTFHIPRSMKPDDVIGVIFVKQSDVIDCVSGVINVVTSSPELVSFENDNQKISMRMKSLVDSLFVNDRATIEMSVNCSDTQSYMDELYEPLTRTRVVLVLVDPQIYTSTPTWISDITSLPGTQKDILGQLCPQSDALVYDVIENVNTGRMDVFGNYRNPPVPAGVDVRMFSPQGKSEYIHINETSQELVLLRSPDRELNETLTSRIICSISVNGRRDVMTTDLNVTVTVHDVDDNPPYTEHERSVQLSEHTVKNENKVLFTFDYDSVATTNNSYRVSVPGAEGVVTLEETKFTSMNRRGFSSGTFVRTVVTVQAEMSTQAFVAEVVLEDVNFRPRADVTEDKKAIHRLIVPADEQDANVPVKKTPLKLELDISATKYASVARLGSETDQSNDTHYDITLVMPPPLSGVLAVTGEGEVYVDNPDKLARYFGTAPLVSTVVRSDGGVKVEAFTLTIVLTQNVFDREQESCDTGCSVHNTEEACVRSCGYGSPLGMCEWREGELTMSVNYSTCTPHLTTCPDGVCSELEMMDFLVCPQDCSMKKVTGQLLRWPPDNRGIYRAKGPCWCEADGDRYCTCDPGIPVASLPRYNTTNPEGHVGDLDSGARDKGFAHAVIKDGDESFCPPSCRAAIAGSFTAFVVVALLVLLGWMTWRRKRRRQAMSLKHVNSLVSVAAVPSDYIVDDPRDPRAHVNRQTSSPGSGYLPAKLGVGLEVFEDKWEFPRHLLILEHVIGEGEFGQVVRAQATNIRGQEGTVVVAVKMLKPDASGAEYQDLVSELQLLKEVDHPNVIKLLGVCTQKGPLYVIVEYCELGSLRNFLRGSKFKNKGSWEDKQRALSNGNVTSEGGEARILTHRDLFSFAWQIGKGMEYLAGLKIVHRDLAARNVLVTEGLMLKISDFGLSRDVYEADTYLKMSKGRIPVKWMAPESLYAQIYTTKSDVWSYGIVLWEIVTLGASPYPGIPPERLFPLLSTGYRMDRPDDCPEELYAIMQKCWKTEPENRPTFSILRDILDHLLQQNTEYLELSDDSYFSHSSASDNNEKGEDLQVETPNSNNNIHTYGNICNVKNCPPDTITITDTTSDNIITNNQRDDDECSECQEQAKLLVYAEIEHKPPPGQDRTNVPIHGTNVPQYENLNDKRQRKSERVLAHENPRYA